MILPALRRRRKSRRLCGEVSPFQERQIESRIGPLAPSRNLIMLAFTLHKYFLLIYKLFVELQLQIFDYL